MIVSLALAATLLGSRPVALPREVTIAGLRGEARIPVRLDGSGSPVVLASPLVAVLGGQLRVDSGWAEVVIAKQPFRFLVGAPLYQFGNQLRPLAGAAWLVRDSLFVPFQFIAEILPYYLGERYRWDARGARLEELRDRTTTLAGVNGLVLWTP